MRAALLSFLLLFSVAFQTSVAYRVAVFGGAPNLPLILLVIFGLVIGGGGVPLAGGLIGLLLDLTAGQFIGFQFLLYTGLGWAVQWLEPYIFKENPLLPFGVAFLATALLELSLALCFTWAGVPVNWGALLREGLLAGGVYNGLLTLALYFPLLNQYERWRPDPRGTIDQVRR